MSERNWYTIYTRPRSEKKVESQITQLQIKAYLPIRTVIREWSDRRKKINEPLFPSYVFVYANAKERFLSLKSRGVVRMVSFNGQPARIPETQIEAVRRILECGYATEDYPFLSKGDAVEIISGPLTGLKGFVTEERGKKHFIVSVEGIYKSLSINIDARILKRIPKDERYLRRIAKAA